MTAPVFIERDDFTVYYGVVRKASRAFATLR